MRVGIGDGARRAMVLAAGMGERMRPLTLTCPKPLLDVCGKPLLAHHLDALQTHGVGEVVINVHYRAQDIENWILVHAPSSVRCMISHDGKERLETGGGIKKALPLLGEDPFFVLNSDGLFAPSFPSPLACLDRCYDREKMDIVLLLSPLDQAHGYGGKGDFYKDVEGRLVRISSFPGGWGSERQAYVFTGMSIVDPKIFATAPEGAFSLNWCFDRAMEQGRFYGVVSGARWFHVGTPEGLQEANIFFSS